MKKFYSNFSKLFIIALMFLAIACKKDEEPTNSTAPSGDEPKIEEQKLAEGGSVKKEKAPRSEKVQGETTVQGQVVTSPTNIASTDTEAQNKLNVLTGNTSGARFTAVNGELKGWFVDAVNGQETIEDQFVIFFELDGTYLVFDYETAEWEWGFYYVDKAISYIVFDPNTQYEDFWTLTSLNSNVVIFDNGEDEITLGKYSLGVEEEEYTESEFETIIADKNWYRIEFNSYDFSNPQLEKAKMIFYSDGSVKEYTTEYDVETDQFIENKEDTEGNSWGVNAKGEFVYSSEGENSVFRISYAYDDEFSLYNESEESEVLFMVEELYYEVFGDVDLDYAREYYANGGLDTTGYQEPYLYDETNEIYYQPLDGTEGYYYDDNGTYMSDVTGLFLDYNTYVYYDDVNLDLLNPNEYLEYNADSVSYIDNIGAGYNFKADTSGTYTDNEKYLVYDGVSTIMPLY